MTRESTISLNTLGKYVLVNIYDTGEGTIDLGGGKKLILLNDVSFADDNLTSSQSSHPGIRPRWAVVVAVNQYAKDRGIRVGDKVLCDTMKWSRAFEYDARGNRTWRIPAEDIMLVDDAGLTEEDKETIETYRR